MFTEDKLLRGLYELKKNIDDGHIPTAKNNLNKLIQATELAIVEDSKGLTTSPLTVLSNWLKKNAYISGYKSDKGRCIIEKDWHIYAYEDFAIYREKFSRGYTEVVSKDGARLCLAVDNADKVSANTLELPTAAELRAYIRINKSKYKNLSKVVYSFGDEAPSVRADLLLDMIELFPDVKTVRYRDAVSPLYFYSYGQDGVLFPTKNYT